MNAIDVMRLIDLVADLDSPSAAELRAFADRTLVQLQTESLRIGVATDGGRPIGDVLALVDELGIKRDVWSLSSIDRPTGVDAWIVVRGDGADRGAEQRFLQRIAGMQQAEVEHHQGSDARDLSGLRAQLQRWQSERDTIRNAVIASHARPVLDALALDRTAFDERLRHLPDAVAAEQRRASFEARSRASMDALGSASHQVIEEMREEVVRCFSDWVETVTAHYGEFPSRDSAQESLEKWLRDRFAKSFADRLSRRVTAQEEELPQFRGAMTALQKSQTEDFVTPAVEIRDGAPPTALRWLFPLAGGGVGYWRGGPKLALMGAALGMVAARMMRKRARRALERDALKSAAANHLATHLHSVMQRMTDSLRTDFALELDRLTREARDMEQSRPERDRIMATLDQLARAQGVLNGTREG